MRFINKLKYLLSDFIWVNKRDRYKQVCVRDFWSFKLHDKSKHTQNQPLLVFLIENDKCSNGKNVFLFSQKKYVCW